jgi:hypothetical protein
MKLDKSKPYAQILGATDGSRFEQHGVIFDYEGNQLNSNPVANSSDLGTTEEPKDELIDHIDSIAKRPPGRPKKVK